MWRASNLFDSAKGKVSSKVEWQQDPQRPTGKRGGAPIGVVILGRWNVERQMDNPIQENACKDEMHLRLMFGGTVDQS